VGGRHCFCVLFYQEPQIVDKAPQGDGLVHCIGIFCLSLTACGGGSVKTSQEDSSFEKKMLNIEDDKAADSGEEAEDEEDYQMEIPDAVADISPEDDEALTGVLTEDSYTNEYFGLKLNRPWEVRSKA
jgi:hypothetical protein